GARQRVAGATRPERRRRHRAANLDADRLRAADRHVGLGAAAADRLRLSRARHRRRPDQLRCRLALVLLSRRLFRRPHSARHSCRRPADRVSDQDVSCGQSQDRRGIGHHRQADAALARRRGGRMKRREFITYVGRAAACSVFAPLVARTQPAPPVVGFLNPTSSKLYAFNAEAFRQGLQDAGFVEGRSVHIEYRWGEFDYSRLPPLAAELVARQVAVIAATGDVGSAKAAQAATSKIPIVFTIGADPVRFGLAASYNRPGGNLTGISAITSQIGTKRIEMLHELTRFSR